MTFVDFSAVALHAMPYEFWGAIHASTHAAVHVYARQVKLRGPHIGQPTLPGLPVPQYVSWLDIAVDKAHVVQRIESHEQTAHVVQQFGVGQGAHKGFHVARLFHVGQDQIAISSAGVILVV